MLTNALLAFTNVTSVPDVTTTSEVMRASAQWGTEKLTVESVLVGVSILIMVKLCEIF